MLTCRLTWREQRSTLLKFSLASSLRLIRFRRGSMTSEPRHCSVFYAPEGGAKGLLLGEETARMVNADETQNQRIVSKRLTNKTEVGTVKVI